MYSERLRKKVDQSIYLLKQAQNSLLFSDSPIEVAYSGGKDSDIILHLAKSAGISAVPIYKNTTIDPPGTINHVHEAGAKIVYPKRSFFKIIEAKGYPSRFNRFCCSELKEYKIGDMVIMGVRKSESVRRNAQYQEPTECRKYKTGKVQAIYPILYWTDEDVEEYIRENNIQLAPTYYDETGALHCERRLGCLCCPLQSRKKRIEEFKKYPKMVTAYIKHGQIYFDTHPQCKAAKDFPDAAHYFILNVFCQNLEEYNKFISEHEPRQFLESFFKIDLSCIYGTL